MKEKKVVCQENIMIRTPMLPFRYLLEYEEQDKDIYEFIHSDTFLDNYFKNALLIASKTLYFSYMHKPNNEKKYKKLTESLLKFFVRATTRATPFGYFASVSLGKFGNVTELEKNQGQFKIDLRVDNEWIDSLLFMLEREEEIFCKLKFCFNKICYKSGNRLKNPFYTNYGNFSNVKQKTIENSIRYTVLIEIIRNKTKTYISYDDLKKIIKEEYADVPEEKIKNTIKLLLDNEYLLSNLRMPAYCDDALIYIIQTLKKIDYKGEYLKKIETIYALIEKYKNIEKRDVLEEIYFEMSGLSKAKNYLILNIGEFYITNKLDNSVRVKVENFANALYHLPQKVDSASEIKHRFSERFGTNVEVPLISIIDPNDFNGLSMIDSSTSVNESQAEKQIDNIINTKIFQAIISGKKEVFFESKDFSDLEYEKDYPKSFELDFIITFLNNQYYLYLGPNSGSSKGGAMFQRFANCFDTLDLKKYNEIYKMEEKLFHEEFLLVEAREFSANGMLENVMNTKKNYKYFITFGNCFEDNGNEITLEDIYVGLSSENEIYLKSRKYNKKIKLVKDNMLNPNMMNKILKLLRIISESSDFFPEYRVMSFRNRFGFKYIPRINFEGIVVSPRRWVLDEIDITYKSYKEFKIKLTKNMEVYGIDSIVYYVYLDNRIIVDLKKDDYIEILYTEFKKMKRLEFQELEKGLMDGALVKDINGNKYINEFVFTLIALRGQEKKFPIMSNDISVVEKNNRFLLGEDGWVFFKLYGLGNRDNEVLCSWLPNLLNILGKPSHFFIRYTDYNGEHLRVRIKFQNEKEAYNKLEIIVNWTKKMITNKVVNNVVFDVYNREINRYGGEKIIKECENIFFKDSLTVEKLLIICDLDKEDDIEKTYVWGIISILKNLSDDFEDMFRIIDSRIYSNKYRQEYRKKHKEYMTLVEDMLEEKFDKYLNINQEYMEEKIELLKFKEILQKQNEKGESTNSRESIILSIIHMYCNRLTGNLYYENKYLEIIRNTLYHLYKKRKSRRYI